MTSSEVQIFFLPASAGLMLGGIFFGGLWWTIRNGINAKQPGLWFLGSMLVRMTIVMAGFYFVGGGQWDRLLSCLLGFIAARSIVVWLTRLPNTEPIIPLISLIRETGLETYSETAVQIQNESHHAT
jgi:F1F0 ATPase subunit 2